MTNSAAIVATDFAGAEGMQGLVLTQSAGRERHGGEERIGAMSNA